MTDGAAPIGLVPRLEEARAEFVASEFSRKRAASIGSGITFLCVKLRFLLA